MGGGNDGTVLVGVAFNVWFDFQALPGCPGNRDWVSKRLKVETNRTNKKLEMIPYYFSIIFIDWCLAHLSSEWLSLHVDRSGCQDPQPDIM